VTSTSSLAEEAESRYAWTSTSSLWPVDDTTFARLLSMSIAAIGAYEVIP
jgi:hypothetical protein